MTAPHAKAATRILLAQLRAEGHTVSDISEAIKRGLLTELDWCSELDKQREVFGVTAQARGEYGECITTAARQARDYRERKKELK